MIKKVKNSLKEILGRPGWFGDYTCWDDAVKNSSGYNSVKIVEKVKDALLKVKNGGIGFERDSVFFDKIEYSWPVLTGLLWVGAQRGGKINVMDFGGSLGSTYFQYRKFFSAIDVEWNVVEQELFVSYGMKFFQNANLKFYHSMSDCLKENKVDVVLLSSVLPYLEEPYKLLDEIFSLNIPYLILDKMPFLTGGEHDRLTVQRVPPTVYEASYPAWFFNETKFLKVLASRYELIEEFENDDKANIPSVFKGFIFRIKN
jgi:putative methyltransferase (TIGR04325 family)